MAELNNNLAGLNLSSLVMDQAVGRAQQTRLNRLGEQADNQETREGLQKTAREFEAVFMNTLMRAMRKTIPENKLFNSAGATKYYQQMHDAEIATAMTAGRSSMGIADLIVQQFSANVAPDALPDAESSPKTVSLPQPLALRRYQSVAPVGRHIARMANLRGLVAAQGGAMADTLKRFDADIKSAAQSADIDPALLLAVTMEESGGDPLAESPRGALGLMQLMPGTATEVGVSDRTDPGQSLRGGAAYLSRMMRRYQGDLSVALAAYNAGPGNVDAAGGRIPDFPETQRYVSRVLLRYEKLGGGMNLANQDKR